MEGATTPVINEEVKIGTQSAFVDRESSQRPVVKGTYPDRVETPAATAAPVTEDTNIEPAPVAPTEPVVVKTEMSDEDFEKELARRTKGSIKSLAELQPPVKKTQAEIEAEEEKEKVDALEWKLSTGTITRKDYEAAILERAKSSRDIALSVFAAEMKEIQADISDEDIEEQFRDYYMEEADDTDPKRKMRLKEMNKVADTQRKERSGFLDTIDPEYKTFKEKQANKKAISTQVDAIFESIPNEISSTSKYKNAAGEDVDVSVTYKIDDAELKAIKKEARANALGYFEQIGISANEVKDAAIANEINSIIRGRLHEKMLANAITEAASKGMRDAEVYYKNIPVRNANLNPGSNDTGNTKGKYRVFTAEEEAASHGRRS